MPSNHISYCGIDFGTTNSSVSICTNGTPSIIPIDRPNKNPSILRSLVYINPSQQIHVGFEAIDHYLHDLKTLPSLPLRQKYTGKMIKVMASTGSGTMKADWVPEIIETDDSGRGRLLQSLKSVLTSSTFTGTNIFGKFYTLEELLTILLSEIKHRTEAEVGHEISSAVIGRPVRYVGTEQNDLALKRMRQIAQNSGFKHIEFEYEPVGAALHYSQNQTANQNILIFDFGGGTLDICIMKLPEQKIIAVSGRGIGGDLLDSRLVKAFLLHHFGAQTIINGRITFPKHFFSTFDSWYQTTLQKTVRNLDSLRQLAIESDNPPLVQNLINLINHDYGFEFFQTVDDAKIALTDSDIVNFAFSRPHLHIKETLTRSGFEKAIESDLEESQNCIDESLNLAGLKADQIDKVILTGGSSQVPIFINLISHMFGAEKIVASDHFTSVAAGLSLRAHQFFG